MYGRLVLICTEVGFLFYLTTLLQMSSLYQKPLWYRWARIVVYSGSVAASGFILFHFTVPTDEELIARFSPEVRADYERNKEFRRKEQEELMKLVRLTAALNDPIWKTGQIKSPFERDSRGVDPKLVDQELFHKKIADDFKKSQIEKAESELQEAEHLSVQSAKRWWAPWR